MKKIFFLLLVFQQIVTILFAQNVAINNDGSQPNPRSILDLKSTDKGFFLPRMTSAQRLAIPAQQSDAGLLVYDMDKQVFYMFNGAAWVPIENGAEKKINPVNHFAADGAEQDYFGRSVAIDGDYAVIGATGCDISGKANQGAAYIFIRTSTGWVQQTKLTASDGQADDAFGLTVGISGDYIAVGSAGPINGKIGQGAVYVFKRNGNNWEQQTKLTAGDGAAYDYFGNGLKIENDIIMIGASGDDIGNNANQGSVYLFTRNGSIWTQTAKLIANDGIPGDEFGQSIDKYGDYIVVGTPYKTIGANFGQGSVYVFHLFNNSFWVQQQKLFVPQGQKEEYFGKSVAIYNNTIVVGVPGSRAGTLEAVGRVSIYRLDYNGSWYYQTTLYLGEGEQYDEFGIAVDMNENKILVGAHYRNVDGHHEGVVLVYQILNTWGYQRQITDIEPMPVQGFGKACGIDRLSNRYIIGSLNKNSYRGAVSFGVTE